MENFKLVQGILLSFALLLNFSFGIAVIFYPLESRATSNLIAHQSLIDSVLCLINILINTLPEYEIDPRLVVYNQFVCHVWTTQWIYWHVVLMSVQNLVCTSLDRYIAVIKATIYKERQKYILIFSFTFVWTVASIVAFPVALQSIYVNNTCQPVYSLNSSSINTFFEIFGVIWFLVCYLLPSLFFVFVYSNIIRIIRQLRHSDHQNGARNNITVSAFIITCFFIVLFSYDTIYYLLGNMKVVQYVFGSDIQKIGVLLITMNSFVNPIVYLTMMKRIRRQYLKFYVNVFHCPLKTGEVTREISVTTIDLHESTM